MTHQEKAAFIGQQVLESAWRIHEANKFVGNYTAYMTHPFTVGGREYEVTVREVRRNDH